MKLTEFKKIMKKQIFTTKEAQIIAFRDSPALVNLQLHQWRKRGELLQLKRGLYLFADATPQKEDLARQLYWPCYFSLEYVLSLHGILPEAVFTYTLVTTNGKREWATPCGRFLFRQIQAAAFMGFDAQTLLATPEKALVDYFYLRRASLMPTEAFWEESRLDVTTADIDFGKVFRWSRFFASGKLERLLRSFAGYATSR